MAYVILRLFYGLWFVGWFVVCSHHTARLFFDTRPLKAKLGEAMRAYFFSFFWPLSLMSKSGRRTLKRKLKEIF